MTVGSVDVITNASHARIALATAVEIAQEISVESEADDGGLEGRNFK
jgi:hypothetical protein